MDPRRDRSRNDLNAADFSALYEDVWGKCGTPDQRERAIKARQQYDNTVAPPEVPEWPLLQPSSSSAGAAPVTTPVAAKAAVKAKAKASPKSNVSLPDLAPGQHNFRLRGKSCLFTYNSEPTCDLTF